MRPASLLTSAVLACASPLQAQVEVPVPTAIDAKVETLFAPLSGMPTIRRAGKMLAVELAAEATADLAGLDATPMPSFGEVRPAIALGRPVAVADSVASRLWPDRRVDRLDYRLPGDLLPDLYDLEVARHLIRCRGPRHRSSTHKIDSRKTML